MKMLLVGIAAVFALACSNAESGNNASDSVPTPSPTGNSAGAITITDDTAHMDSSLHHIQTDNAK